jgi:transposase
LENSGCSASEISASLGLSQTLLSKWVKSSNKDGDDAFRGNGHRKKLEEENWKLKLEVKRLEQELQIQAQRGRNLFDR